MDTTYFDCGGGPPIQNLQKAYLYGYRSGWTRVDSLNVAGMEGLPDSFQVGVPGPYYVTTVNPKGESCASNIATIPGPTTGVPVAAADPVIRTETFNVQGRVVRGKQAAGIYWQRTYYKSGRIKTGKVVVLK